jgi:hypothetical protein
MEWIRKLSGDWFAAIVAAISGIFAVIGAVWRFVWVQKKQEARLKMIEEWITKHEADFQKHITQNEKQFEKYHMENREDHKILFDKIDAILKILIELK